MQVGYRTDPTTGKAIVAYWPLGMVSKNEKDIVRSEPILTGRISNGNVDVHPDRLIDYLLTLGVAQVMTSERAEALRKAGLTPKEFGDTSEAKERLKQAIADFNIEPTIADLFQRLYNGTYEPDTSERKEAGDWFSKLCLVAKRALVDAGKPEVAATFEETTKARILANDQSASKEGIKLGRGAKALIEERLMNPKKFKAFVEAWKACGFQLPGENASADLSDLGI